jgi:hypothetical protein
VIGGFAPPGVKCEGVIEGADVLLGDIFSSNVLQACSWQRFYTILISIRPDESPFLKEPSFDLPITPYLGPQGDYDSRFGSTASMQVRPSAAQVALYNIGDGLPQTYF